MENYGNCDQLEYELRNACWGYFSEDGTNNSITLYDTCDVNVIDPEKSGKHPGSAILAVGEIRREPVVGEGDELFIHSMMTLTLSCDHRVIDGVIGAAFLKTLKDMLEDPIRTLY